MIPQLLGLRKPQVVLVLVGLTLATCAWTSIAWGAEGEAAVAEGENFLVWVARCSGLIGAFLLVLSIYFVAKVCMLFVEIREQTAAPPDLLRETDELIHKRDFRGAYQRLKESETFFGNIVSAAIPEMPQGLTEAREVMDRAAEAETLVLEKKIGVLAVIGTLGPMIGLLGTLKGMIASFSVIAMSSVELNPSEVASGISEALLLTFEGVALSVPAIYFFSMFRNRVAAISASTSFKGDQMLRKIYQASRSKPDRPPRAPAEAT
ncbi:MAG: MotA/TolQ/ExbB proton channel family protein [Pirellulales bacterium]|nr:MotA/TolQ/ExbB proton channel family protein [Pirellulales bacterium]